MTLSPLHIALAECLLGVMLGMLLPIIILRKQALVMSMAGVVAYGVKWGLGTLVMGSWVLSGLWILTGLSIVFLGHLTPNSYQCINGPDLMLQKFVCSFPHSLCIVTTFSFTTFVVFPSYARRLSIQRMKL